MTADRVEAGEVKGKDPRRFGLTLAIAFGAMGALAFWRGKSFYPIFLALSAGFLVPGLVVPSILRPVHRIWMPVAEGMGWFMTRVMLAILFYVAFTTMGLLGRLFGKQFLDLRADASEDTYWVYRGGTQRDREDYERQY